MFRLNGGRRGKMLETSMLSYHSEESATRLNEKKVNLMFTAVCNLRGDGLLMPIPWKADPKSMNQAYCDNRGN